MNNAVEGKRIFLVEDDANIALMIQEVLLDEAAAEVRLASSVATALAGLQQATFDMVILDLSLGGEMAWPVAAELSRRQIPYLVVSGYGDSGDARLAGARLLAKPYSISALLEAIGAALNPSPRRA
jgi:DNA-binding response OmpR family regulator